MKITTLFVELLGLHYPWTVGGVHFSPEGKKVDVSLTHRTGVEFPCPECGVPLPVYDHVPVRTWRHLDTGPAQTLVHARVPRVSCLLHGVHQTKVPWALPRTQFTLAFESWAIDVLRETDVLGATRLLHISWDEAWGIMERAVARGQSRKQRQPVTRLGVDEKAIAKGQTYFTLVCDLDRGTIEYVSNDRKQTSLDEFYDSLTVRQLAAIEAVAMDMWDPYIASTTAYVPRARQKIVFDRYHVMKYMLDAVDSVRKEEHRVLQASDDETLKGTKHLWLYSKENLPEYHEEWFARLRKLHLKTGRAWAIKESLRDLWACESREVASRHWKRWYYWATHSRLESVVKAARTIERHVENVLTYFEHRISNATSEGLNSKIQTVKKTPVAIATASTSRRQSTFTAEGSTSTRGKATRVLCY